MNGFADKGLDESNFGGSSGTSASNVVQAFDAFPKTKPSYTEKTATGGTWTVILICASLWLTWSELSRWWVGHTTHSFSVEQGVGHDLQINLDLVVKMKCEDVHVNLQDASGDRILARQTLSSDPTIWRQWHSSRGRSFGVAQREELIDVTSRKGNYREEDVHNYLGATRGRKTFKKTPKPWRGYSIDSCRIYGTMHTNKVQGDFHITARGHGYMELGNHLDHSAFNFSHRINELSFGPFYPSLTNPLDDTYTTCEANFFKYQYYLSVVPTIYTTDVNALKYIDKYHESPSSGSDGFDKHPGRFSKNTVFTNQYAVTEQSRVVPETQIPGIFVKFDIEPILLTIAEEWASVPSLFIRLVNVVSGVVVAGGWCFQLTEWARDQRRSRKQAGSGNGLLSTFGGGNEKQML